MCTLLTDLIRACPIKSGLAEAVRLLRSAFMQRVLVAENDKYVTISASVGAHRKVWTKTAFKQLAYLRQAGISVLYSHNKGKVM